MSLTVQTGAPPSPRVPPSLAQAPAESQDSVRFYGTDGHVILRPDQASPEHIAANEHYEKLLRLGNDVGIVLGLNDSPAILALIGTTGCVPALTPFMPAINVVNAATGYIGTAFDLREAQECWKNPDATPHDKRVESLHLVSDVINTASSMVPLFVPVNSPLTWALFGGGQIFAISCDVAKTVRDWMVGGTQSAQPDPHNPEHMILDRFASRVKNLSLLAGGFAVQSLVFPNAAFALPMLLASPLMGAGGSFATVGAYNDIMKARDLTNFMNTLKQEGVAALDMPVLTMKGIEYRKTSVDDVIKATHQREALAAVQGTSGALMLAASVAAAVGPGALGLATGLAIASVATGGIGALAGIGLLAYKNRQAIASACSRLINHFRSTPEPAPEPAPPDKASEQP